MKLSSFSYIFSVAQLLSCAFANTVHPRAPAGTARIWSAMQTDLVDHVYSTNASEITYLIHFYGFKIEGPKGTTTGYIHTTPVEGTVPLYRLYSIGLTDHYLTASEDEKDHAIKRRGYHLEGILGYLYPTAGAGRVPFYQLHNPLPDHYYTSSEQEREDASRNGWANEGVVGYLLPIEEDAPKLAVPSDIPKP
ncbi:hypothetical protein DXG01_011004 [Tephrocybe rancida]|nr:hypothetical protein DXG01_011004 [Tephrocybe rancida]